MLEIGLAFDPRLHCPGAFGRAIAARYSFRSIPINLDQNSVIDVGTERAFNGFEITTVAVAGQLNAVGEPRGYHDLRQTMMA
jgi:hypothetical protein